MIESRIPAPARRAVAFAALVAVAVGCGARTSAPDRSGAGTPPESPASPAPAAAPSPPELRLPTTAAPRAYRARLAIDPAQPTFAGRIEIDLEITQPSEVLWLNAHNLTVREAQLRGDDGAVGLEVVPVPADFVGLRAPEGLVPGRITVVIDYEGKLDESDTYGVFRQQERGDWYAYTQFQAIAARRAFPCFDEPSYKVPWQLSLEVPANQVALSNTPAASEEATDRGTRLVTFAPTRPLPSYLIAFAVGPFELVDAGTSRSGVPLRIVTMRGRSAEAAWAVESTRPILDILEDYFGTPYPYEKLDSIAVPLTVGFGAMENPGLITYSERLILARPEDTTETTRRRYAYVAAHELAHQWFGNLVTPAWWNDIWLNEAFATWIEEHAMAAFRPEWQAAAISVQERTRAMGADQLATARQIHQPITNNDDIEDAFDSITYEKGAAVIRMFEHWVGPEVFRRGVQAHLAAHADGVATSADFLAAIGAAADRDVATPFATFLDQVGTPLVSMELRCERGAPPTVTLTQERYRPIASEAEAAQIWQVPVCVRYPSGRGTATDCTLLTEASGQLALASARSCPVWIAPNADGVGYYRSRLSAPLLDALLAKALPRLSLAERTSALYDAEALVAAGDFPPSAALELVRRVSKSKNRYEVGAALALLGLLDDGITEDLEGHYGTYLRQHFGVRAARLGWTHGARDDLDVISIRALLVPLLAGKGEHEGLARDAARLARAWLSDRAAVPAEMTEAVLRVAARRGDAALFEAYLAELGQTRSRRERGHLFSALGSFRDPGLRQRALELMLSDAFDIRESSAILWSGAGYRHEARQLLSFVSANVEALVRKLPEESGHRLARVVGMQCDEDVRAEADSLLERIAQLPSGPRAAASARERMALCIARRQAFADDLLRTLGGRPRR